MSMLNASLQRGASRAITSAAAATITFCSMPLSAAATSAPAPGSASAVILGGTWGKAIEIPGLGALNKGGNASVDSVSCASAGNCSAGGQYRDGSGHLQAFVVSEVTGTWRTAREVPGTATLNGRGNASVESVSCASAGNCSAAGFYDDHVGFHAFVLSEVNGAWGKAIQVPGLAALNAGGFARVKSVSCASAGNCAAGGFYTDGASHLQVFVVSEAKGTWRKAIQVPGLGALNAGGGADINSVSCASAGNCGAGGFYTDGAFHTQAFVVSEVNGSWGKAHEVPGLADLNTGGIAGVTSVSCASRGNCSAVGGYRDASLQSQAFVVNEVNGTWRTAREMPGLAALNLTGGAGINSVSCVSPGNCGAGGFYKDVAFNTQAFVVSEVNGTWRKAMQVPGLAELNAGGFAEITSVSCVSAGNCGADGQYLDGSGNYQALVVSDVNGIWGKAIEIPGLGALNKGGFADVSSVSCTSAGHCGAGGVYADGAKHRQGFVVSEK
jgi:hypothetical protein